MNPTSPALPHALVISLPEAHGRRRLMQAQLEQPGMPSYEMVDGVDARRMDDAALARVYDEPRTVRDFGRALTRGEVGCALAHVAAYRRAVELGNPLSLVFEDDAVLGHQFLMVLRRVLPMMDLSIPQVVLLCHVGRHTRWGARRIDKLHRLVKPYYVWGGHAYLMTLPAAKALLAAQQPVHVMPDSWIYFMKGGIVDLRGIVPYVVGTAPLAADSHVGNRDALNRKRGLRPWLRKYLWQKFIFQLVVKPALRIRKDPSTW